MLEWGIFDIIHPVMNYKRFSKRNLEASDEGTREQQKDMAGMVTHTSQIIGELSDLLGGRRKQKDHIHHSAKNLTDQAITGINNIVTIRREIDSG
jgi:hypothetical protein